MPTKTINLNVEMCNSGVIITDTDDGCKFAYNDETETYDEGFDPDKLSYHDIVLNIIKELKAK